ncbi:MAG: hypothetical protein EOM36_00685 [Bacteroidia bacterium]|nr:hypothetical protein [Bacteroidia bacterium]
MEKVMKKLVYITVVLSILSGCTKDEKREAPLDNTISIAGIIADPLSTTKSNLGQDGLSALWSANDSIGVFSASTKNTKFTLSSGNGTQSGTFSGTINGAPLYAYYPYDPDAGEDPKGVVSYLDEVQEQSSLDTEIGKFDFKASYSILGTNGENCRIYFRTLMSLMSITIDPTGSSLVNDKLLGLLIRVNGRELAGEFTIDITDIAAKPNFGGYGLDYVNIVMKNQPVLTTGTTIKCRAFMNAAIKAGDAVTIDVITDRHLARVSISASKDIIGGYRYNIPIVLASGQGNVQTLTFPAFYNETVYGSYDYDDGSANLKYRPYIDQWAVVIEDDDASSFRIQNKTEKWVLNIADIPVHMLCGQMVKIRVDTYGLLNFNVGEQNAFVIAKANKKAWLYNTERHNAYIVYN